MKADCWIHFRLVASAFTCQLPGYSTCAQDSRHARSFDILSPSHEPLLATIDRTYSERLSSVPKCILLGYFYHISLCPNSEMSCQTISMTFDSILQPLARWCHSIWEQWTIDVKSRIVTQLFNISALVMMKNALQVRHRCITGASQVRHRCVTASESLTLLKGVFLVRMVDRICRIGGWKLVALLSMSSMRT